MDYFLFSSFVFNDFCTVMKTLNRCVCFNVWKQHFFSLFFQSMKCYATTSHVSHAIQGKQIQCMYKVRYQLITLQLVYIYTKQGCKKNNNTQIDDKLSTIKQDKKQTNQKNTWQSIDSKLTSIAK